MSAPSPNPRDPLYTRAEAMRRLGVGNNTLHRLTKERRLGHVRIGRRIYVRQSDIDAFIKANTVEPTPG